MANVYVDKRTGNIVVRAYAGINPATGKPHSVSETLPSGSSDGEVDAARDRQDARASISKGNTASMTVQTVVAYYLEGCEISGMSPTTLAAYRSYIKCHIVPRIGSMPFDRTDAALFSKFFRDLRRSKSAGGAGLSTATVEKIHALLSGCFTSLLFDGVIGRNPMAGVKVARGESPEAKPLSKDDFGKLMEYLEMTLSMPVVTIGGYERITEACIWWTALHTGLRRGELAGALEEHFEPSGAEIPAQLRVCRVLVHVSGGGVIDKEPKSKRSKAKLPLDADTERYLEDNIARKNSNHSVCDDNPLFAHVDGRPYTPNDLTSRFSALKRELKLANHVHLHTLRHTHATYLIADGEDILTVQERMRHASGKTTMDIYGHVLPGRGAQAARRFANTSESMVQRTCNEPAATSVPTCPLTGKTCARFGSAQLEK